MAIQGPGAFHLVATPSQGGLGIHPPSANEGREKRGSCGEDIRAKPQSVARRFAHFSWAELGHEATSDWKGGRNVV